ncbi:transposase [Paracoccus sp. MC1862]|nr:transposase [Paracoccus sp. MC1862]
MRAHLRGAERIFVDETPAPMLDPGRKATKSGHFRAAGSDDRGHGGAGPPLVLFHYASGRGGEHPLKFLDGYRGRLPRNAMPASLATRSPGVREGGPWQLAVAGPMSAAASSIASRTCTRRPLRRCCVRSRCSIRSRRPCVATARPSV